MDKFLGKLEKFDSNLWQYHIPVPEEIATAYIEGENRRVYCTLKGQHRFQCALMKSQLYWYVLVNKEIRNKLAVVDGDLIEVLLEKDHSQFGHDVPEEFQVMMDQDEEGNGYFYGLTPGKQRALIYLVTKVKNSDSRIKKSLAIFHHLKEVKGKLDFKMLNETIKLFNKK
jgi:hypothetical protein